MPASLPGDTNTNNRTGNPAAGQPVAFDLLSGPKGSPMDKDATGNASTGALSTGIGFNPETVIGGSIPKAGFTDDYTPGVTKPDGTASANSTLMYIGGGKSGPISTLVRGIPFPTAPYTAGFGIGAAGNGGSRDAGAGPAFTGFQMKIVTAPGAVAPAAAIEAGFINRTGAAMVAGQSALGSSNAASAAVA
jgi:hypothetical protein